jgi:hypothetical protein
LEEHPERKRMPQTLRQFWQPRNGRDTLNFNWDIIDHDSVVLITASEYHLEGPGTPSEERFIGDATITVSNIAPHGPPYDPNHGVTFVVNVEWDSPIGIVTSGNDLAF